MIAALLMAMTITLPPKPPIEPPIEPCEVYQAEQRYSFIEENNLVRVKVSCYYAEPGAKTADGSIPVEGMVSSNRQHLGMDMVLYTDDLIPEARFQCTDIGGHKMLQDGTAVDFYRSDYSRCVSFVKDHSPYVWVQWVEREEVEDETVSGNSVE